MQFIDAKILGDTYLTKTVLRIIYKEAPIYANGVVLSGQYCL